MFARSRHVETAPAWFSAAIDQQPDHHDREVNGCRIHLRVWGAAEYPPVVLVHGGGAHSGWWDHIAPLLSRAYRVIAPDLSGHGDSDYRTAYDLATWSKEVIEVSASLGTSSRPTIVGHSLGGWVAADAARRYGEQINSILLIDSPLRDRPPEESRLRNRQHTRYRSRDEILARFIAVPTQQVHSALYQRPHRGRINTQNGARVVMEVRPRDIGDNVLDPSPTDEQTLEDMFTQMRCRVGYLRCEAGLVPAPMAERIRSILQLSGPFIELAQAGHHPMLDQPLPLIAALCTLLEFWSIT